MTPEETDEAVARKLGWTFIEKDRTWFKARSFDIQHGRERDYLTNVKDEKEVDKLPPYSTEIKAAWEILESLDKRGHYIIAFKDKWHCQLVDGNRAATELADTAPMAIALCFLKLK